MIEPARIGRLAYLTAAINMLASVAMVVWLRPGLPAGTTTLEQRLSYVTAHAGAWRAGWLTWHAAAIALVAFYLGLALLWARRAPLRCGMAMVCAAAGLAADLAAEVLAMSFQPGAAPEPFLLVESAAGVLTGYVANGMYTVAGILLTWAAAPLLPRSLLWLGAAVWLCGIALSAASLVRWPDAEALCTALLMPSFVVWCALMGRWLGGTGSRAAE